MRDWHVFLAFALMIMPASGETPVRSTIDLNGSWEFRLDPNSAGERDQWFLDKTPFRDSIQVPGCWQAQGFGERSGILRNDYSGPAWYRRTVRIPASWKGKRVTARIGGALRTTDLFVNGVRIGTHDGMSAPFKFDVTYAIRGGSSNVIAIRVTNPGKRPGESPDKQAGNQPTGMLNYIGNWGGIYGPVTLEATGPVWVDQVWIRPSLGDNEARIGITVHNSGDQPFRGHIRAAVDDHTDSVRSELAPGQSAETEIAVRIRDAHLWSPDDPFLYTAAISVFCGDTECDRVQQRFGMREINTRGKVLLLNGKPLYLRGYGDDDVEVLSGVPPASKEVYLERLRRARSFGFNAVRFHSFTPVSEFFEAADEVGLLVMSELPVAYTQYFLPNKEFLRKELEAIIIAHRNHPSWLSLAMGNEFNLRWLKDEGERARFLETVREFYNLAKSLMPDRIVMSNDGFLMEPTDMVSTGRALVTDHPVVRHEFGAYYCSLPDLALIPNFTGVIAPAWLTQKAQWVEQNGLAKEYATYVTNSQRLVQLGRKYQIETARQDPNVTGYGYWLITDYPGGTGEGDSWEEGWFDFFWHPKGVTPEQGRELNSAVLPLIDRGPGRRTLWAEQAQNVMVSVSNYGDHDLSGDVGSWRITSGADVIAQGRFTDASAPVGAVTPLGAVSVESAAGGTGKMELAVDIDGHSNHWQFWAFPKTGLIREVKSQVVATGTWPGLARFYTFVRTNPDQLVPSDLWITPALDDAVLSFLLSGGRVWLALDKESKLTFFPASGGALGTVVEQHPALDGFPHEGFADLQFYSLMEHATPFDLDGLPNIQPIVGGIRTRSAFLSKSKDLSKAGYVFEAKIGSGRLLVTTLRMGGLLDDNHPEAVYLFDRVLRYCGSDAFQPRAEIASETLERAVADYLK